MSILSSRREQRASFGSFFAPADPPSRPAYAGPVFSRAEPALELRVRYRCAKEMLVKKAKLIARAKQHSRWQDAKGLVRAPTSRLPRAPHPLLNQNEPWPSPTV